ncbi:glucuronate isomerase [Klebsiella sp. JL973]|uniref:glucuronate isomerase n=1 Tax=Klebsiella TaxID=570 RepID=UPI0012B79E1C|nr:MULTISPECIES: glucuronate isomerase [Klebsiella]MBZ6568188.1 glucuronate isomerase [Klebsiella grimontii]MBZ7377726.1 glucuronate isomerase [Klebsiella grimontii]MTW41763.1 glucuronate isomerase [Klebsiella sp. JL973]
MPLINDSFMISNPTGKKLYLEIAREQPIIDYHCHLEAKAIWENEPFADITQLWLEGDHYKWRAMRANGIPEEKITGNATAEEKFAAWAQTVEACFGNPLYHWTHLELKYYFNIDDTLNSRNWHEIMTRCNEQLRRKEFLPQALIRRSNVEALCTTDGPLDNLEYHQRLTANSDFSPLVLPTFRPDELFDTDPESFQTFISRLAEKTQIRIASLQDFLAALESRIDFFHTVGCRISDHGPLEIVYNPLDEAALAALFQRRLKNEALTKDEQQAWDSAIFIALAKMYKQREWAMQIHFGAIRNNNKPMFKKVGINCGFDSVGDQTLLAGSLNALLNAMGENNGLPKTILYNLNAGYNDVVASAIANFQSGEDGVKSPLQFGSGWWFNDTRRGMVNQLNTLADQGLLANFVGMLTDSRSFVSYTRHDYFRRILCDLIGGWVENGEVPDDKNILTSMIRDICVENARRYFRFSQA